MPIRPLETSLIKQPFGAQSLPQPPEALTQKEIQAYFTDPATEATVQSLGWGGQILPNKEFQDYIKKRSKRAKDDPRAFQKQLSNYARSFASAKISLLREMGVVRDKRNDYTITGEI